MHVFQNSKQLQQMQGYALAQVLVGQTAVSDFAPVLVRLKEFSLVKHMKATVYEKSRVKPT